MFFYMGLNFMLVKKAFKSQFQQYSEGDIYLVNEDNKKLFIFKLQLVDMLSAVEFIPIDELIKPINLKSDTRCKTFVIRSGGIGDLIALSTVCEQMPGKVLFLTNGYYKPVFEWYRNPTDIIDYTKPIFTNISFKKRKEIERTIRYAKFDDSIEFGDRENWYHIFYNSIGMEIKPELCRPHLVYFKQTKSNIDIYKKSILIQHRASANMRSTSFQAVYEALANIVDDVNIYVHDSNLTKDDLSYIESTNDARIKIIHSESISGYLNDLYDANLTISVDSAAIHFREGVKKPAIGIYNSFTAESRCKYYKFTYSFNILSPCPIQPCFLHQTKLNEVCSEAKEGTFVAPCVDPNYNSTLISQLQSEFLKAFYKLDILKLKKELV